MELLDYGRFVAAFGVLVSHYFNSGFVNHKLTHVTPIPWLMPIARFGTLGVPFFFMISGYVIFFSAMGRSARTFAVSRLVRLFPAYWFAVLFTASFAVLLDAGPMRVSGATVVANLTMAPQLFGAPFVDGVYWTLQYELVFYTAVALVLLLGLGRALPGILVCWPAALVLARLLGIARVPLLEPVYAFFALGAIFAMARERWSLVTGLAFCVGAMLCLENVTGVMSHLRAHRSLPSGALPNGIAMALFCVVFAVLNTKWSANLRLPLSEQLGRMTYPLYLIHAHWGFMMLNLTFPWFGFLAYPLVIGMALFVAWSLNTIIERRCRAQWVALFDSTVGALLGRLGGLRKTAG